jgi:hypothetical protein
MSKRFWVAVALVLTVVVGGVTWKQQDSAQDECCNAAAVQPNLANAVTGARTYYLDSGHTFLGLTNSKSLATSSLQEIGTGLSFVSGGPSPNFHVISTKVGDGGSYVVLVAFEVGRWAAIGTVSDCWGILDLAKPLATTVLGISRSVGSYFFVIRHADASACNAATIKTVSASSTSGFPNP